MYSRRNAKSVRRKLRIEALEDRCLLASVWDGATDAFNLLTNWDPAPTEFNDSVDLAFDSSATTNLYQTVTVGNLTVRKDNVTTSTLGNGLFTKDLQVGTTGNATLSFAEGMSGTGGTVDFKTLEIGVAHESTVTIGKGVTAQTAGDDSFGIKLSIGNAAGAAIGHLIVQESELDLNADPATFAPASLEGYAGSLVIQGGSVKSGETALGIRGPFTASISPFDGQDADWTSEYFTLGLNDVASLAITSSTVQPQDSKLTSTDGAIVDTPDVVAAFDSSAAIANPGAEWLVDGDLVIQKTAGQSSGVFLSNEGTLTVNGDTTIGENGTGNLEILDSSWDAGGDVVVGDGGDGHVDIATTSGVSVATVNGTYTIGDDSTTDIGAWGLLHVDGATTIDAGGSLTVYSDGIASFQGGGTNNGSLRVQTDGLIRTVAEKLINKGQIYIGSSPGRFDLDGDFEQTTEGSVEIEIEGTQEVSQYDVLRIHDLDLDGEGGEASLAGTLDVSLLNGFTPEAGQSFVVLDTESAIRERKRGQDSFTSKSPDPFSAPDYAQAA